MTLLRGLVALLLTSLLFCAPAQAGGFDGLGGSWSGGGRVMPAGMTKEKTSCSVTKNVSNGGNTLNLKVQCSSDNTVINIACELQSKSGAISGTCRDLHYGVRITVVGGTASGNHMSISVTTGCGSSGTARLTPSTFSMRSQNPCKIAWISASR